MSRGSGLRDLRGSSATSWRRGPHIHHDAHGEWNRGQALRLDSQILKRRSRRSEGGQTVQELNSIREGKYWDDVKRGWLDPVLIQKAREEEMQYVKKHEVYEKVPMSQCGNVRVSEHKISMGREGTQHGTQARLVQHNITCGRSEARHLGGSVKQPEGNSALGDGRAKSVFLCEGEAHESTSSFNEGDGGGPSSRQCGLLRKSQYGTRDAAHGTTHLDRICNTARMKKKETQPNPTHTQTHTHQQL